MLDEKYVVDKHRICMTAEFGMFVRRICYLNFIKEYTKLQITSYSQSTA